MPFNFSIYLYNITSSNTILIWLSKSRIAPYYYNHCGANGSRTRVQSYSSSYLNYTKIYLIVGASGFEPKMTAPKTVVLPLHHAPKLCQIQHSYGITQWAVEWFLMNFAPSWILSNTKPTIIHFSAYFWLYQYVKEQV